MIYYRVEFFFERRKFLLRQCGHGAAQIAIHQQDIDIMTVSEHWRRVNSFSQRRTLEQDRLDLLCSESRQDVSADAAVNFRARFFPQMGDSQGG